MSTTPPMPPAGQADPTATPAKTALKGKELSAQSLGRFVAWCFGIALTAAPVIYFERGPEAWGDWLLIYAAGVFGGMAFEMVSGKGQLELPSFPTRAPALIEGDPRGQIHSTVDLGFFARAFTGGLAAIVLTVLYHKLVLGKTEAELVDVAATLPAAMMAVATGYAAPKIWESLGKIAESRAELLVLKTQELQQRHVNATVNAELDAASTAAAAAEAEAANTQPGLEDIVLEAAAADPSRVNTVRLMRDVRTVTAPPAPAGQAAHLAEATAAINRARGALAVLATDP